MLLKHLGRLLDLGSTGLIQDSAGLTPGRHTLACIQQRRLFLILELAHVQDIVCPMSHQEFLTCASFKDAAILDQQNLIGFASCSGGA